MSIMDYYLLASLVVGLIAWILPLINFRKIFRADRKYWAILSIASMAACAISLYMQIFYNNYLVEMEYMSTVMDISNAIIFASTALLVATIALNAVTALAYKIKI